LLPPEVERKSFVLKESLLKREPLALESSTNKKSATKRALINYGKLSSKYFTTNEQMK
jgi:hypothetical protein